MKLARMKPRPDERRADDGADSRSASVLDTTGHDERDGERDDRNLEHPRRLRPVPAKFRL